MFGENIRRRQRTRIYKNDLEVNLNIEKKMLEACWKIVGIKHAETT